MTEDVGLREQVIAGVVHEGFGTAQRIGAPRDVAPGIVLDGRDVAIAVRRDLRARGEVVPETQAVAVRVDDGDEPAVGIELATDRAIAKRVSQFGEVMARVVGERGLVIGLITEGDEIAGVESCRRVVRENIGDGRGSDLIKFTGSGSASEPWGERDAPPTSFDDEVEAIVATARVLGRKVAVHAHSAASINQALRAGAWTIEHGTYFDNESVRLFRERKAYLVPTSFVGELMLEDPRIKARNTPEDWQRIKVVAQHQLENAGRGYRAGVALGVGTDSSSGLDPHNTMREIEIFVRDGIPVEDALKAATLNNAAIVGHSGDLGEVRSGYIADVVAMPASPLKDVRALRDIDFVMKDGKIVRNDVGR